MEKLRTPLLLMLCVIVVFSTGTAFVRQMPKAQSPCDLIKKSVNNNTGEIIYTSPPVGTKPRIIVQKDFVLNEPMYSLQMNAVGDSANLDASGVTIIFEDGTVWTRKAALSLNVTDKGFFQYTGSPMLIEDDLPLFTTKKIKKYLLYTYSQEVTPTEATQVQDYIKCIRDLKK